MRVALFGGTFDPIHRGHVEVARRAAEEFQLGRVLIIPSGNPPHRASAPEAGYAHRLRMAELACESDPRLTPSRHEAPGGPSRRHYSVDTIQRVRAELVSGARLFFLIGADAFADVRHWRRWEEVVQAVEFIVASRPGTDTDAIERPSGAAVHWLRDVEMDVSSTEIREKLAAGEDASQWLPESVLGYIREHGLYGLKQAARVEG